MNWRGELEVREGANNGCGMRELSNQKSNPKNSSDSRQRRARPKQGIPRHPGIIAETTTLTCQHPIYGLATSRMANMVLYRSRVPGI